MASPPPGFPRSLLGEPWSARLTYFQRYTVAHPKVLEAKERLVVTIQNSEPNSPVFVFGPTGVGKTALRLPLLPPGHITREQRGHPLIGAWTKAFAPQPEEEDDKRLCCRTAILW